MTEKIRKALDRIRKGDLIECSAEDYRSEIRASVILFALDCADGNDEVRMQKALAEVKRLDTIHGQGLSAKSTGELT
jgi:chromosome condensin MukBEF MukE localization factor